MPQHIEHGLGGVTMGALELSGVKYLQVVLTSPYGDPYSSEGGGGGSSTSTGSVAVTGMLPAGIHSIGNVGIDGYVGVTGTFWQTTQPVSFSTSIPLTVTLSGIINQPGSLYIGNNQVSVSGVSALVLTNRATRRRATIENYGSVDVYLGASGVSTSTGLLLRGVPGAAITLNSQASIFGITTSSVQTLGYLEEYD